MLKQFFAAPLTINRKFFRFLKDNHIRQCFIDNFHANERLRSKCKPPCRQGDYIMMGFPWSDAPQPSSFWSDLHHKWLDVNHSHRA